MKLRSLLAPAAVGLFLLSASATADAGWQHNVSHKFAANSKTTLKITGADGLKASVTIDGNAKEDTIPAIFSLPDHDAFIPVTITSADGKVFNQKIEVKAHQQTDLAVKYEGEAKAPAAAAPGRKFLGHAGSFMERCKESRELKMEFLRSSDGQSASSIVLKPQSSQNVELTAGQYDVRLFWRAPGSNGDFSFWRTEKLEVTADEWIFAYGCKSKREAPGRMSGVTVR
jgi:hypothetical protein